MRICCGVHAPSADCGRCYHTPDLQSRSKDLPLTEEFTTQTHPLSFSVARMNTHIAFLWRSRVYLAALDGSPLFPNQSRSESAHHASSRITPSAARRRRRCISSCLSVFTEGARTRFNKTTHLPKELVTSCSALFSRCAGACCGPRHFEVLQIGTERSHLQGRGRVAHARTRGWWCGRSVLPTRHRKPTRKWCQEGTLVSTCHTTGL